MTRPCVLGQVLSVVSWLAFALWKAPLPMGLSLPSARLGFGVGFLYVCVVQKHRRMTSLCPGRFPAASPAFVVGGWHCLLYLGKG